MATFQLTNYPKETRSKTLTQSTATTQVQSLDTPAVQPEVQQQTTATSQPEPQTSSTQIHRCDSDVSDPRDQQVAVTVPPTETASTAAATTSLRTSVDIMAASTSLVPKIDGTGNGRPWPRKNEFTPALKTIIMLQGPRTLEDLTHQLRLAEATIRAINSFHKPFTAGGKKRKKP